MFAGAREQCNICVYLSAIDTGVASDCVNVFVYHEAFPKFNLIAEDGEIVTNFDVDIDEQLLLFMHARADDNVLHIGGRVGAQQ